MDLYEGVKQSYLAQGLVEDEVRELASVAEEMRVGDLGAIVRANEQAADFYLLIEGKATVQTEDGQIINRLGPGSIIGEAAILAGGQRLATVLSDGESLVAKFPGPRFNDLLDRQPRIGVRLLRNVGATLVDRLRSTNIELERVLAISGF